MVVVGAEPVIIIGIDFGTTYSGVAWARSRKPDQIMVITNWDAQLSQNADREKAPTQIFFNNPPASELLGSLSIRPKSPAVSREKEPSWGYNVPIEETPLKWFKLLLIDDAHLPTNIRNSRQLQEARSLIKDANKTPIEAVSTYLRALWIHTLGNIKRAAGQALFNISKLRVIITLPAIWPHYAQMRMRHAAKLAGILDARDAGETQLGFVPEPEAAALATMSDLRDRPDIEEGDHFVVCDAGGGTVDIITYEVTGTEPFRVKESVQGDGKLCGGVFLDEAFIQILEQRVGVEMWRSLPASVTKKFLNDEWEHGIKSQFDSHTSRSWTVQLPWGGDASTHYRRPEIQFSAQEIFQVFDPVSRDVVDLVSKQISAVQEKFNVKPKYVILVGGFGRCRYLYDRLSSEIEDEVDVLQGSGDRPWTAICRGGVIKGINKENLEQGMGIEIGSRVSRSSYGTKTNRHFTDGLDDERDRFWCKDEIRYKARSVSWFLKVGEDVTEKQPVVSSFYRLFDSPISSIKEIFSISGARSPPTRPDHTVAEFCSVSWNKAVDFHSLPIWRNSNGKVFRKLEYEIEMTTDGASVDFAVIHKGARVASHNVSVNYGDMSAYKLE